MTAVSLDHQLAAGHVSVSKYIHGGTGSDAPIFRQLSANTDYPYGPIITLVFTRLSVMQMVSKVLFLLPIYTECKQT